MATTPPLIAGPAEFAAQFGVSRETLGRLEVYAAELVKWQKTINLVAPSTLPDVWHRHFADSAQLVALAPVAGSVTSPNSDAVVPLTWIDLGSGAGFPGLVAAIMLAPTGRWRVTLVESDSRKAAFLRHVARTVGVPVDNLCERAERAATRANLAYASVISARALAPLTQLLAWALPFAGPETVLLLPKGRDAATELQDAEKIWQFEYYFVPSLTDAEARVVVISRLTRRR
ncbi:MAG: 16S rRNA (guanine(527)-N(7))-methyltransferase RsmG [Hyphomicrobium aestuarii]|nr:16S rRNA (guanine(527)-N(7))-methyltransferase RsmG [Hyphomicrobium aestuarii]